MIETLLQKIGQGILVVGIALSSLFGIHQAPQQNVGAVVPVVVAVFQTSLQASITASATSMTLVSGTDKAGNNLSGYICFNIDEGTAIEEFVCGTASGTSVTSMLRGLDPVNGSLEVTALKKAHRRGASVKITNYPSLGILSRILNGTDTIPNKLSYSSAPTFTPGSNELASIAYADALAIAGSPDASTITKGIAEEATQAEINAGTATGGTSARLFINPSTLLTSNYGLFLPSTGQKDALVGTSGTPGSSNKYVTNDDTSTTSATSKIPRADSSGKIDDAWLSTPVKQAFTLGENISANQTVYIKPSDGLSYKASAAAFDDLYTKYIGVASETGTTGQSKSVQMSSILSGFSLGVASQTVSAVTETSLSSGGNTFNSVSTALLQQTFITGATQENISSFEVYLKKAGAPNNNLTVSIYEVGTDGLQTGAALVTKNFTESDLTTSYVAKQVITSPISVKPRQKYAFVFTHNSSNISSPTTDWAIQYNATASTYLKGEIFFNNIGNQAGIYDGSVIDFIMKYTAERNYYPTDDLYLSDTAGAVSLNGGTKLKKIGEIMSSSQVLLSDKYKESFLYTVGMTGRNGGQIGSITYFPLPRNTRKIIVTVNSKEQNIIDLTAGQTSVTIDEGFDYTIATDIANKKITFSNTSGVTNVTLIYLR